MIVSQPNSYLSFVVVPRLKDNSFVINAISLKTMNVNWLKTMNADGLKTMNANRLKTMNANGLKPGFDHNKFRL